MQDSGGIWHDLARNKKECLKEVGCRPDPSTRLLLPMEKGITIGVEYMSSNISYRNRRVQGLRFTSGILLPMEAWKVDQ